MQPNDVQNLDRCGSIIDTASSIGKERCGFSVKALKYLSFDSALWKRFAPELFFELIDFFSESLESLTVIAIAQIDFHIKRQG